MIIQDKEINNIDEALSLLTDQQQAHSKRVAKYCEIAFKAIVAKGIYISHPRAQRELIQENAQFAYISGLYHDIGKVLPDGEEAKDHTQSGAELFESLYPNFQSLKGLEKKLIEDGILDHHERLNGLGGPKGLKGDAVSFMGRIVAIADILDNRAMLQTADDPITEALTSLKEDVKAGFFDPEFFKAFTANRAKLKKVYKETLGEELSIPKTQQWIKRKASRPMELVYRTACKCGQLSSDITNHIWIGEMRFRGTSENNLTYQDVKKTIAGNKLGGKLGEYFIYELCDAYKRFTDCGLNLGGAAMILPTAYVNTKGMAKQVETILADEGLTKEQIVLVIPEEASKRPSKALQKNIEECKEKGILLMEEYEFLGYADAAEEVSYETEEQIVKSQVRSLQQRAKQEEAWDRELQVEAESETKEPEE